MRDAIQYQNAIENSNIVSKTDINGIIIFVNDEFCKISKYTQEELIGQNHNIVRHPDVPRETFKKLWDEILAKKTYKTTAKNLAKDGSTFYVNTTISPILDENNNIKEFIAIRYDVTKSVLLTEELREKEKELKELNSHLEERVKEQTKQLRNLNKNLEQKVQEEVAKNRTKDKLMFQQSRLIAMGEMIANIAHQWRQPLFELNIILYNLKKSFTNNNQLELDTNYNTGKQVIQQMSQTIDDFRNFFNPEKNREFFYIRDAINETISIMSGTLIKEKINIKFLNNDDFEVFGYKNEFSQVILSILNNSKDAFKDKRNNKVIKILISKNDDTVFIQICDNAGGIQESVIDKIFEPYFTTKYAKNGTGLGLYICKMIIESSMKGKISASNICKGACFNIDIPIK